MSNPAKRLIYTIVTALVFLGIYAGTMFYVEKQHYEKLIAMHNRSQTDSLRGILDRYEHTETEIGKLFYDELNTEVRLKALSLAAGMTDGQYKGLRMWENGMAVRATNGKPDLPAEAAGMFPELTAEIIRDEYVQTRTVKAKGEEAPVDVLLTSGRIAGDWYYVRWTPVQEYDDYIMSYFDKTHLLKEMSDLYSGEIFLVSADDHDAEGEKGTILYGTEGIKEFGTLSEIGVREEDLQKDYFEFSLGGTEYICSPAVLESGRTIVCCDSIEEEKAAFYGEIITQLLFAAFLISVLIVWCYYSTVMVIKNKLSDDQVKNYTPEAVRRKTARLGGMSVLLVFIVAFLTVAMQYMYQEDKVGSATLTLLENQVEAETQTVPEINRKDSERYKELGAEISGLLTEHPDYLTKGRLKEMAGIISADYLIVFDENGDEIACSENYTGFSMGTDEKDSSSDFRRLLKGIPAVVHDKEEDFITREERQLVGVRYELPGQAGRYGAILISIPLRTEKENPDDLLGKQGFYRTMASTGEMILEIDPDSQLVVSGSREDYVGSEAAGLGFKKEALADRHMDFFRIDRKWYFGISRLIDGKICYYMADNTAMLVIGMLFAGFTAAVFMCGYWLTSKYALHDYTSENYNNYLALIEEAKKKSQERLDEATPSVVAYVEKWDDLLPERKTKRVFQIGMGIFMSLLLLIALSDTPMSGHSVLNFVIEGNWTKGLNVFGIVAAIMVFSIEYLAYLFVKVCFLLLYGVLDAKGETIGRLIRSFINYILIAVSIFLALNFLGVDTSTLLASLGLLSLAISLGAKDIVADILFGIGVVFEGTYSVGDVIEVGGFKGRVIEINIRTTKLLGPHNEIKTINNSNVNNVLNLSKKTSFCTVKFTADATDPLGEIEAMLARELPAYKEKIPGLISGPRYLGVTGIADGRITLEIIAEAKEENLHAVGRGMNRMLQSLYERGLIDVEKSSTSVVLNFAEGDTGMLRTRVLEEKKQSESSEVEL